MLAAKNGHVHIIEMLLKAGAHTELRNKDGGNALMVAAANGQQPMSEYAKHRYDVKYTARFIILPSSQQLGRAACFCQAHSGACQAAGFLWSHCITSTYFGTVRNSMQSRQLSPTRSKTHSLLLCLGTPSQNRPRHPTTCQSHSSLELSNMLCINQGLLYAVEHAKLWGVTMSTPLTIQVGGQVVQV